MGIDRYDLYVDEYEHEPDLHYHECGDWVRFEDHEQVVAELESRSQFASGLASQLEERNFHIDEQFAEITRLRAELAAKSKDVDTVMNAVRDHGNCMTNSEIIEHLTAMGEGNGR